MTMRTDVSSNFPPVALITGGVRRLGAAIARELHAQGMSVVCHYRQSREDAEQLKQALNDVRPDSVEILQADLEDISTMPDLVAQAQQRWGRLDVLVNNASTYAPTPIEDATPEEWDSLFASNTKAPFFLAQACAPFLRASPVASIINITDINSEYSLSDYAIYCATKASLTALTRSLAKDLAPHIRVNAVAPGPIDCDQVSTSAIVSGQPRRQLLSHPGEAEDIAQAVSYFVRAKYVTGETITVDGGTSLL